MYSASVRKTSDGLEPTLRQILHQGSSLGNLDHDAHFVTGDIVVLVFEVTIDRDRSIGREIKQPAIVHDWIDLKNLIEQEIVQIAENACYDSCNDDDTEYFAVRLTRIDFLNTNIAFTPKVARFIASEVNSD